MNDLTNNEIIFLMKLMDGIANGIESVDPQPFSDEDGLSSAYNCAIKLRKKMFDELERRIGDEAGCDECGRVGTVKGLGKQDILDYFSDINYAYNDCTKLNTLSDMLDKLIEAGRKYERD